MVFPVPQGFLLTKLTPRPTRFCGIALHRLLHFYPDTAAPLLTSTRLWVCCDQRKVRAFVDASDRDAVVGIGDEEVGPNAGGGGRAAGLCFAEFGPGEGIF